MTLNERKTKILEAIVVDYISTAEPVGSRTISKKYALGVSSATIRNDMSDLEEMGLIMQPHTSAGRVPSDLGYRLYVDNLMKKETLTEEQVIYMQEAIMQSVNHLERLMRETARAVAHLTKYAAIVSNAANKKSQKIKHVQLVPIDSRSFLVVAVKSDNSINNKTLYIDKAPPYKILNELSQILNNFLANISVEQIDKKIFTHMLEAFGKYEHILLPILGVLTETEKEDAQSYVGGIDNFLSFPEFSEPNKIKNIIRALEEKGFLLTLPEDVEMQIVIGAENNEESLRDCSIVKAMFKAGSHTGVIGVIGPTRMNYARAVSALLGIIKNIEAVIAALKR